MSDMQKLHDERAIAHGLGRFARVLDQKAWGGLGDVFAADVSFDYGGGNVGEGIEVLERSIRRFLDACGPTQHLIGSIMIDVDGDSAVSRAYVQARHQRRDDPAGGVFDSNGEYVDRWRRGAAGWRIVRRDAHWLLHTGDPGVLAAGGSDLG